MSADSKRRAGSRKRAVRREQAEAPAGRARAVQRDAARSVREVAPAAQHVEQAGARGLREVRVERRLAQVGRDRQDALSARCHRHRQVGDDRRLALAAVRRGHGDHDRLAVADAVERERGARRAERLDERRGALEVADDVARAVDLVEARRRNRADRGHVVGGLDVVDRDQPAIESRAPERGGDADQQSGDCAEHRVARGLGLEGGGRQMGRVAHDEVAVRDRAVGCRKRQLVAQVADRGGRVARRRAASASRSAFWMALMRASIARRWRPSRKLWKTFATTTARVCASLAVGAVASIRSRFEFGRQHARHAGAQFVLRDAEALGRRSDHRCRLHEPDRGLQVARRDVGGDVGRAAGRQVDQRLRGAVARRRRRATPHTRRRRRSRPGGRSARSTRAASSAGARNRVVPSSSPQASATRDVRLSAGRRLVRGAGARGGRDGASGGRQAAHEGLDRARRTADDQNTMRHLQTHAS